MPTLPHTLIAEGPSAVVETDQEMNPIEDERCFAIENAADGLRQLLPPPDRIKWPTETGDLEAIDSAMRFLKRWLPLADASYRRHKRALAVASHKTSEIIEVASGHLTQADGDAISAALKANYVRARQAQEAVNAAAAERRVLLVHGHAVGLSVATMALVSDLSRQTVHLWLRQAGSMSSRNKRRTPGRT